jgi:prevent-host-death family protein
VNNGYRNVVSAEVAMRERSVGIRELKSKLSQCVREVKGGTTIVVAEHGRRVARLIPEADSLDDRLATLRNAGAILWSGSGLGARKPSVRARGRRTVADILVEGRG